MAHKLQLSEMGETRVKSSDPNGILYQANDQLIKSLAILRDRYLTTKEHLSDAAKMAMLQIDQSKYMNLNYDSDPTHRIPSEENLFEIRLVAMYLSEIASLRERSGGRAFHAGFDTGYFTACLAIMLGDRGQVFAVDSDEEIVDKSIRRFQHSNPELLSSGRVTFIVGDGGKGLPGQGPYDVMAMCVQLPSVLPTILSQLNPGGILIATVGDVNNWSLQKITKDFDGKLTTTILKKKAPVCGLDV